MKQSSEMKFSAHNHRTVPLMQRLQRTAGKPRTTDIRATRLAAASTNGRFSDAALRLPRRPERQPRAGRVDGKLAVFQMK